MVTTPRRRLQQVTDDDAYDSLPSLPSFLQKLVNEKDPWGYGEVAGIMSIALPISFKIHTIEYAHWRWTPSRAPAFKCKVGCIIKREATDWYMLADSTYPLGGIEFPHEGCLKAQIIGGDSKDGCWPVNTPEEFRRAKKRLCVLLGGINLASLATPYSCWPDGIKAFLPSALENYLSTHEHYELQSVLVTTPEFLGVTHTNKDVEWEVNPE